MFKIKENTGEACVNNSECQSNECWDFQNFSWLNNGVTGFQCMLNFVINHLESILNSNIFLFLRQ
jgi:hypothetical protein